MHLYEPIYAYICTYTCAKLQAIRSSRGQSRYSTVASVACWKLPSKCSTRPYHPHTHIRELRAITTFMMKSIREREVTRSRSKRTAYKLGFHPVLYIHRVFLSAIHQFSIFHLYNSFIIIFFFFL